MWSIKDFQFINFVTIGGDWNEYNTTDSEYAKTRSKCKDVDCDLSLESIIDHCKQNTITIKTALIIAIKMLNVCDIKSSEKILFHNELMSMKEIVWSLTSPESELSFIQNLETPQKCIYKRICFKIVYMLIETYHIARLKKYIKSLKDRTMSPTFILGFTVNDCNYFYCDEDDFNMSVNTPSGHSQLYLIDNYTAYHYDPDTSSILEQTRIAKLFRGSGYKFKSLTYETPSIQAYLDDIYCIFHTFRYMLIIAETNIRDKKKLGEFVLRKYPYKQLITKKYMEKWIDAISIEYL
jgi:hypothetical protein